MLEGRSAHDLFDRSPERTHELVVDKVSFDSENNTSKAIARGRAGAAAALGAQDFEFDDPKRTVQPGQRLVVKTRRGAFGWEWRSSAGQVHVGKHVLVEK